MKAQGYPRDPSQNVQFLSVRPRPPVIARSCPLMHEGRSLNEHRRQATTTLCPISATVAHGGIFDWGMCVLIHTVNSIRISVVHRGCWWPSAIVQWLAQVTDIEAGIVCTFRSTSRLHRCLEFGRCNGGCAVVPLLVVSLGSRRLRLVW